MKFNIIRKIAINKPVADVHKVITDFNNWNSWSPWFHCEPTTHTEVHGSAGTIGHYQTWDGKIIGSGKQTLAKVNSNQIETKLEFFKPWKGLSQVVFDLKDLGGNQTEITWTLYSSLPFFMFFFRNMMIAYMSNDFDRGLIMLKELVETGKVDSRSIFQGDKDFASFYAVGRKTKGSIKDISSLAKSEFENIQRLQQQGQMTAPMGILTFSHIHDIPKGVCEFSACGMYSAKDNLKVPEGFEIIEIPKHKGMLIDHYGPYRNLGNPWSMAASHQRVLKKKILKKIPSYEIYRTMPGSGAESDIHTQIIMPLK